MRGWLVWFSARQLMWATILVLASGILLLVPLFIGPQRVPTSIVEPLRSLHAAASVVLVVGTIGHGVLRAAHSAMTRRALVSGILASTILGLAVVSGVMAAAPEWWADRSGTDAKTLEDWSSVFHFGYSAAILLALVFWHVRPSGSRMVPRADRATLAWTTVIVAAGIAATSSDVPSPLSRLLAPTLAVWAWWTVLLPQLLWLGLVRTSRKPVVPRETGP